jgi:hypothetical protein
MNNRTRYHGIFIADAVTGLGILLVLGIILGTAIKRYHAGTDRLTDTRFATRLAEQTLLSLQSGQPAPKAAEGDTIEVTPIPDGNWVRVRVTHRGRAAELLGVVPKGGNR